MANEWNGRQRRVSSSKSRDNIFALEHYLIATGFELLENKEATPVNIIDGSFFLLASFFA